MPTLLAFCNPRKNAFLPSKNQNIICMSLEHAKSLRNGYEALLKHLVHDNMIFFKKTTKC